MKSALSFIACLLFVLCLAQVSAYAQEGPDNEHPTYEDKAQHDVPVADMDNDLEGKTLSPTSKSVAKDSSATRTATPRIAKSNQEATKEKPQQGQPPAGVEDDSILSFNFIYYIIQKFKLQDIIE
jgi:hypothetical protein